MTGVAALLVVSVLLGSHNQQGAVDASSARVSATPTPVATTDSPASSPTPTDEEGELNGTPVPVDTSSVLAAPAASGAKNACRSDPLANVYHPSRLQVISPCSTVSGIVESVRHEDDGDYHFDLALDSKYQSMLVDGNNTEQHGWLVVEIVPADESGCVKGEPPRPASGTYDYGVCTGANLQRPTLGQHVWVTGPYVIDTFHGWAEIHPAWAISTSAPTAAAAPVPAPQPAATTTAPKPAPTTAAPVAALSCSASMSNATPAQYTTTTVIVRTAAGAYATATAHYKSTNTTNSATAGSNGVADIPFKISRATKGYTVMVDVTVSLNGRSASCTTSFTPQ
jgi:hypothetical protein